MTSKTPRSTARILDQFYTDPAIAADCVLFAKEHLEHLALELVIEPSAGSGAFSNLLNGSHIALDIDPKDAGVEKADFLTWQPPAETGTCLVIGNPPFGKASRTAVKFFNHAAEFADAIAFIVPLSFRKQSIQTRLDPCFHLTASRPLPRKSFLFEGKPYAVPCEFQIWERRETPRRIEEAGTTHPDFEFCAREEANFAIQRIGANAGRIKDVADAGSANSHYFIRANRSAVHLRALFEQIDFDQVRLDTAAVPSIAKSELVALYMDQMPIVPALVPGEIRLPEFLARRREGQKKSVPDLSIVAEKAPMAFVSNRVG